MATIGEQLTTPESGWKRIDNNHEHIEYEVINSGNYTGNINNSYCYNGTIFQILSGSVKFKFYGTKCRIISIISKGNYSDNIQIFIDGEFKENINCRHETASIYQALVYEISELNKGIHNVKIINNDSNNHFGLDAIDVDEDGFLVDKHSETMLQVKNDIKDMEIGDCIPCRYTSTSTGKLGYFSEFGKVLDGSETFIPYSSSNIPDGFFYFIKADNGTLIADRNIQHTISHNTIRAGISNLSIAENPAQVSYTDPYIVTCSSVDRPEYPTYYPGYRVFDKAEGVDRERWIAKTKENEWIKVEFPTPKNICEITIIETLGYNRFKDFIVSGSNNNEDWAELYSGTILKSQTSINFKLNNKNKFKYLKFDFINCHESYSGYGLVVGEIYLYENIFGFEHEITLLTGGVSYIDSNGEPTVESSEQLGGWSLENDWEKYIVNSSLNEKITPGDDDIWHYKDLETITKSKPAVGVMDYGNVDIYNDYYIRIFTRGKCDSLTNNEIKPTRMKTRLSSSYNVDIGFRPVIKYIDPKLHSSKRPSTLFY